MGTEMRVHGPPGTGKTGKLANEIVPLMVDRYGPGKVMLTSFTKAAANELGSRVNISDSDTVGTLHSICYKALGHPALTEEHMREWNMNHAAYSTTAPLGKECFDAYQVYRNKIIPRGKWRPEIIRFSKLWEEWKKSYGYSDFIDLIENASNQLSAPGSPAAIIVDEAQDFTKLEMKTLRQWATQCREFWVIGDEDQCLYDFSGASPTNMLFPELPPEQKIILGQSYRIPKAVHKIAERIIHRVTVREPKEYLPRPADGSVQNCSTDYNTPEWVIGKALDLPGTSMIIVSCNYMLQSIIAELRNQGVPFSNPWRKEEKSWNPLDTKSNEMVKAFLGAGEDDGYWDSQQFVTWAKHLKVGEDGLIRKQGKSGIAQLEALLEEDPFMDGLHTCREYITDILSPNAIYAAMNRDIEWLKNNIVKSKIGSIEFPLRVLRLNGIKALTGETKIYVGTIHSTKGAEADNVFLYPDISMASSFQSQTLEGFESLCRLFYVGVTRAKENLFLMQPASRSFFSI